MNSVIVSLAMTAGVLLLAPLAGYGFARLQFPGCRVLFVIVLLGLAIPEQAVIIGRHQMFSAVSMHNTYTALVLPGLAMPFGVFLMTQYFRAIPKELDEAAMLDGASRFTVFWRVLLPLTIPAQATLGIFTFFHAWNDYWWPLISATNKDMLTLTVGIAATQVNFAQAEGLGFLMAQAVFAGLPTRAAEAVAAIRAKRPRKFARPASTACSTCRRTRRTSSRPGGAASANSRRCCFAERGSGHVATGTHHATVLTSVPMGLIEMLTSSPCCRVNGAAGTMPVPVMSNAP
jgi:ABC-type Fe3+ transport system permease subunit